MKPTKRILCVLFEVIMLLTSVPLTGLTDLFSMNASATCSLNVVGTSTSTVYTKLSDAYIDSI